MQSTLWWKCIFCASLASKKTLLCMQGHFRKNECSADHQFESHGWSERIWKREDFWKNTAEKRRLQDDRDGRRRRTWRGVEECIGIETSVCMEENDTNDAKNGITDTNADNIETRRIRKGIWKNTGNVEQESVSRKHSGETKEAAKISSGAKSVFVESVWETDT